MADWPAENVSRITIANDYHENGYRAMFQTAFDEPCLLNAILAVAVSHYAKWHAQRRREAGQYLRPAFLALHARLQDLKLVYSENTVAAMLSLLSYEIFNGSSTWPTHYEGICGWLAARGDSSDLQPFIKTWIAMIDTQRSLNLGKTTMPEVQRWLDSGQHWLSNECAIDPFFGCSVRLPKLMAQAARLFAEPRQTQQDRVYSDEELRREADSLQQQVAATKIYEGTAPRLAVCCHGEAVYLNPIVDINQHEHFRRLVAVAEIFRHAAHLYIHRITHDPGESLPPEMRQSVDAMIDLLTIVPDAQGPGSNLGWCLTVLGAELDSTEHRDYVRARLRGIRILGLDNPASGEKVLEEVWAQRDAQRTTGCRVQRWQDVMQRMGEGQILI